MLTINNLSKSFGSNVVLKDFTYHFKLKRVYALMGANGSGKTTLFNIISGFLHADSGTILFDDKDISAFPPHRIAYLGLSRTFQDMRLIPSLSVYDNVLLALKDKPSEHIGASFLAQKKKS